MKYVTALVILPLFACSRAPVVASPQPSAPAPASRPASGAPVGDQAVATINDVSNTAIGSATFADTPAGLLVTGKVTGLGLGVHGIHLHAVGSCQTPTFASAGGHFNPGA